LVAARTQYLFSLAPMPQVIGLSAEIRGVRYPGTATIVSSPTATATGQGVNPEVHTSDGHPLAMLVHQVLGYDTKWTNGGDGSVWEFNLARPLTGEQQMRLADLANEQKIGMTFRYQDSQWRAEPQETQ
jgi:hypothetical protein